MNESKLKSSFMFQVKTLLPNFLALRHEDVRTSGIPDMSITGAGQTTWWEAKYADPRFESTGIQELTMLRLAAAGYARYIVWEERRGIQRTLIVHPRAVHERSGWALVPETWCVGFNHRWLVEQVMKAHRL